MRESEGHGVKKSDMRIRLAFALALATAAAGCSVADHRAPIEAFAQATRDTETALVALDRQVTDSYAQSIRGRVLAGELFVQIRSGDCRVESGRCRIVVLDGERNEQLLSPDPVLANMVQLIAAVRRYAEGLHAIATADTAAQVGSRVDATVGSLKSLAATVGALGGTDSTVTGASVSAADYATPVGEIVSWGVGQYVARVQLDGLRRATADAREVVAGAGQAFALAADEASRVPRAELAEAVSVDVDALRERPGERTLDGLIASAERYDRLLLGKPPAVFGRLVEAHDALVAKLHDEDVSWSDVVARIETFAAEAHNLAAIVRDLRVVGAGNTEG